MKNAVDAKAGAHTVTPNLWGNAALQNLKVEVILVNRRVIGCPLVSATVDPTHEVL